MRNVLLVLAVFLFSTSAAFAHCGKPHPESKDKPVTSRPTPKPE